MLLLLSTIYRIVLDVVVVVVVVAAAVVDVGVVARAVVVVAADIIDVDVLFCWCAADSLLFAMPPLENLAVKRIS